MPDVVAAAPADGSCGGEGSYDDGIGRLGRGRFGSDLTN